MSEPSKQHNTLRVRNILNVSEAIIQNSEKYISEARPNNVSKDLASALAPSVRREFNHLPRYAAFVEDRSTPTRTQQHDRALQLKERADKALKSLEEAGAPLP